MTDLTTGQTKTERRQDSEWITFKCKNKKEAVAERNRLLTARSKGEYVSPSKMLVSTWLREWFDKYIAPTKRRRTVKMYRVLVETVLVPAFGAIRLQELKPADVQKYIADAMRAGYAPASIRMHLAVLSGAFKAGVVNNLVTRNVVALTQGKPRVPSPTARVKANTWTGDEAERFLAETKKHGPMAHAYYETALATGARRSELAGLTWSCVNFERAEISILQELDPDGQGALFGPTKTDTARLIDGIGDEVLKALREHRAHQAALKLRCGRKENYDDHDLVFCREHEHLTEKCHKLGQPLYVDSCGPARLERLVKLAGVKRISPHGLRDTCASAKARLGIPLKVISERLGHARGEMTLARYISVLPGMQREAGQFLNELFHGRIAQ